MPNNNGPVIHEQIICANLFIRKDNKYLVLRRSPLKRYAPNIIHPVGGMVEIGENPYTAALREAQEETGVTVKNVRLEAVVHEVQPVKDDAYDWLIFHFSGDYESGDVIDTDEGELVWLTVEEIKRADLFPSMQLVVGHILNPTQGTIFATIEYDEGKRNILKHTLDYCAQ